MQYENIFVQQNRKKFGQFSVFCGTQFQKTNLLHCCVLSLLNIDSKNCVSKNFGIPSKSCWQFTFIFAQWDTNLVGNAFLSLHNEIKNIVGNLLLSLYKSCWQAKSKAVFCLFDDIDLVNDHHLLRIVLYSASLREKKEVNWLHLENPKNWRHFTFEGGGEGQNHSQNCECCRFLFTTFVVWEYVLALSSKIENDQIIFVTGPLSLTVKAKGMQSLIWARWQNTTEMWKGEEWC